MHSAFRWAPESAFIRRSMPSTRAAAMRTRCCGGAVAVGRHADAAVVDDELVEADRQQVAGQVADGAVEIAAGERSRQLDHAHHQARVGQADPHVVRELVLGEERSQLDRKLVGVHHLAIDDQADR